MSEDDDSGVYDSGPFCRHWSDPADCDILCATCGHRCHPDEECYYIGDLEDCRCPEWKDPPEES